MKRLVVCFVLAASVGLAFAEGEAPVTSYDEQPAQFVEYLESMDGACRIDTEYVFKTEPRMVTTMWLKDSQDYDVAGTPLNVAGNFIVDFNDSLQKLWYRYGSVNAQTPMYTTNNIPQLGPICGRWVKCDWGRVCYLDGIKLCEQTSSSALASFANNEQTFSVFAGRRNVATALKVKFRDVQLYDGGVLVRDLRPALRQNGDPCYYDTITRRCYVNVGREYDGKGRLAAFPAGGQARIKTFVEYLHSPGSCTIDTGYVFQEKPRVKTTMRLLSVADSDVCGTGQAMDGCFIIDVDDSRHKVFL